MIIYILRRCLYSIPILIGVNFLTFFLFFVINSPDDMAAVHLGQKYVHTEAIENWKKSRGYDLPLFFNEKVNGLKKVTQTIFFQKSIKLFSFEFGQSDAGRHINDDISQRMLPSLFIALPTLILGVLLYISIALFLVFFKNSYLDLVGVFIFVIMMSISTLFYIIGGQYIFAKIFNWFPISGYVAGPYFFKFLILPILIGIISGIGSGGRWYRTLFLEAMDKEYVRTAHAKGLSAYVVLSKHVLPNALIPILTGVVAILPLLFLGSLLMESFFSIPGLGSYIIDAINQQDFAIVRCMVFLGSVLYIVGLILTDISYTIADPRVSLE